MTSAMVAAVLATMVLSALAVLQVLVACGLPLGRFVWGGQHRVLPPRLRVASAGSVLLYAAFALILLSRSGLLPYGDSTFIIVATWVLFAYFVLGVVMNAISRSPTERWTMTPVCIALAAATLVVALG